MIEMNTQSAAELMNGTLIGPNTSFCGVSTDTRRLKPGELFFALKGKNFDAHLFLKEAVELGASAVVAERDFVRDISGIQVANTESALARLARGWRKCFELPVIAVTGSNGKTTVKEMIRAILSESGRVLYTKGNLNNQIGVPLTLFGLSEDDNFAVVELGARHVGDISYLSKLVRPNVGVVTQCAPAHLKGFGSINEVALAKGELFECLDSSSIAVVNIDDDYAPLWQQLAGDAACITFGLESDADISATWSGDGLKTQIELFTPAGSVSFNLHLPGRHNVMNALAATAAPLPLGVDLKSIRNGLQKMQSTPGRLSPRQFSGVQILDDTYNANPGSLRAGLEVLSQFTTARWLVLGDMLDLGDDGARLHREVGALARQFGVDRMFGYGALSREACEGFGAGAAYFSDIEGLIDRMRDEMTICPTILIKGSRAMRMERVIMALRDAD